jgi:hypothetical protein
MDRPRFAFRIIALLTSLLATACATNMTNVATFGDATSTVAQQTNAVLTKIPQSCRDQLDLLSGQLALANSVIVPSASNTGAFAPHTTYSAQQRLALGDYAQRLTAQQIQLASECERMATFTPVLQGMSSSLAAFASALTALAKDEFVTYKPELDSLTQSIAALPVEGNKPLLDTAQVSALSGLQALIYKAATESYRQAKLTEVLDQGAAIMPGVVSALKSVSADYADALALVAQRAKAASEDAVAMRMAGLLYEPIAQQEFQYRLKLVEASAQARIDALKGYDALLDKVSPTLKAARDSVRHVPVHDVIAEVKAFAQQAYDVQQKLQKAF